MSTPTRQGAARGDGLAPHGPAADRLSMYEGRSSEHRSTGERRVIHVAVVVAWDRVRFTASAPSRAQLLQHVARYVRRHADQQLWAADARDVRALLEGGRLEAAVERYFALVGGRWDKEWLVRTEVDVDEGGANDADDVLGAA